MWLMMMFLTNVIYSNVLHFVKFFYIFCPTVLWLRTKCTLARFWSYILQNRVISRNLELMDINLKEYYFLIFVHLNRVG
jgi:hypothetical protein